MGQSMFWIIWGITDHFMPAAFKSGVYAGMGFKKNPLR